MLSERNRQISEWAIKTHADTNHMYGKIYPYALHLNWVASVARKYIKLVPLHAQEDVEATCYCHDTIEDCRVTVNDLVNATGSLEIAYAVYALTNEKGKNRKERANDKYYEGIRNNEVALFVKCCDRIANMSFSKLFGGSKLAMYRKELPEFIEKLGLREVYPTMVEELEQI